MNGDKRILSAGRNTNDAIVQRSAALVSGAAGALSIPVSKGLGIALTSADKPRVLISSARTGNAARIDYRRTRSIGAVIDAATTAARRRWTFTIENLNRACSELMRSGSRRTQKQYGKSLLSATCFVPTATENTIT